MENKNSKTSSLLGSAIQIVSVVSQGTVKPHCNLEQHKSYLLQEEINKIYFCLVNCENLLGTCYHAFIVVKTKSQYWQCEISGSTENVFLSVERCTDFNPIFEATCVENNRTIQDLISFSKNEWLNTTYDIVKHNCFDYCSDIMSEFTLDEQNIIKIVQLRGENIEMAKSAFNSTVYGVEEGAKAFKQYGTVGKVAGGILGGFVGFMVERANKARKYGD